MNLVPNRTTNLIPLYLLHLYSVTFHPLSPPLQLTPHPQGDLSDQPYTFIPHTFFTFIPCIPRIPQKTTQKL